MRALLGGAVKTLLGGAEKGGLIDMPAL